MSLCKDCREPVGCTCEYIRRDQVKRIIRLMLTPLTEIEADVDKMDLDEAVQTRDDVRLLKALIRELTRDIRRKRRRPAQSRRSYSKRVES